tara:strand:- start:499 stop:894 length:396 start_codon:yes stop_codon:yes gene_type:complete
VDILKYSKKKFISYVNNNSTYTKNIPQHLQRLAIKEFAAQKKFQLEYEYLEYNNMDHLPILFYLLESKKQKNIVLFSIYSIGTSKTIVNKFFNTVKKNNKKIFFADENLSPNRLKDTYTINKIISHKNFIK